MKKHEIQAPRGLSLVCVGESVKNLNQYTGKGKNVVITDPRVRRCLGPRFPGFPYIEIEAGEANKTLKTVEKIYRHFLNWDVDRTSFVTGIGGGFICDIAGFAASTFMQGMDFGFVPTTLRAQVDSSIGGQQRINFRTTKNLIGVFNQPQFVLCDTDLLFTLPEREVGNGTAEVVKHALIKSTSLFEYLEQEFYTLLSLRKKALEKVVNDSVLIKSWIVQSAAPDGRDPQVLHFGDPFASFLEQNGRMSHGEALSIGMVMASKISASQLGLSTTEVDHIAALLQHLKLPIDTAPWKESVLEALKKRNLFGDEGRPFVMLAEIGKAEVVSLSVAELECNINAL